MDEEIEELAKRAVKIAEKLPDKFQEKGFEVLLNAFLRGTPRSVDAESGKEATPPAPQKAFLVPIDVRAFLQQYDVPEESLSKLFYIHGNEIRPTYKISSTKKATAQTQIAVLTALESALLAGKFGFSFEAVRERCKEHKCYDAANFAKTFKNRSNLFKSLSDEEHVELSPDGKAELAETIAELSK